MKEAQSWLKSDVEPIRKYVHEQLGPNVIVELEQALKSPGTKPPQYYLLNIGAWWGIFKSRNDRLGMITYAVSKAGCEGSEELYGTQKGAVDRVIERLKDEQRDGN